MQVAYGQVTYLKKFIWEANICSDIISLPPVCVCSLFDGIPSPLSANLIIEISLIWCVRFSKYFCLILTNIIEYETAHKSSVLTRPKNHPKVDIFQDLKTSTTRDAFVDYVLKLNADFKICQYLRLHMKIICQRFRIKTPFTFWDRRTWDTWRVAKKKKKFTKNRIR